MISSEEKKQALSKEKWLRHNLYYVVGSIASALITFLQLINTINSNYGEIVKAQEKPNFLRGFTNFLIGFIIFIIYTASSRIKSIEQLANDWEQANDLGRGKIIFARRMLIAAIVFWILQFIIIERAGYFIDNINK